jgi:hypothetical protein
MQIKQRLHGTKGTNSPQSFRASRHLQNHLNDVDGNEVAQSKDGEAL